MIVIGVPDSIPSPCHLHFPVSLFLCSAAAGIDSRGKFSTSTWGILLGYLELLHQKNSNWRNRRETSNQDEDEKKFLGSLFLGNSHQVLLLLVAPPDLAARTAQVAVADSQ